MDETRDGRIAFVRHQLARLEKRQAAMKLAPRSRRRRTGPSVVFSVRLDPAELAAVEARAAMVDIKPTVLARNLIRTGLTADRDGGQLAAAVDRLEAAIAELRSLVD